MVKVVNHTDPVVNVMIIHSGSSVGCRVVTVLAFSVFFGLRAFNIFVRVFFGLSGLDYYVNEGYLVAGVDIDTS